MRKTFLIIILLFSCAATLFAYADYGVDPNGGPFFDNYKQLFTFIAKLEGLSAEPDTIRKLAEESTIEPIGQLSPGRFIVIDVEYMGKEFSKIRSFHNNGSYYILLKNKKNFKLVGCVVGNRYRWDIVEDRIRIIVNYHFSIEPCEAVYLWNGKSFQPISPPDSGSKTYINSPCPTSKIDYHILKLGLTYEKTISNVYKWALEQFADGPLDSSDWAMYVADRGLMEAKVDLDFDGMPELFLRQNAYARNHLYQVFSPVKGGYRYLGNFSGRHFKILPLNKDKKPEILILERCHGPLCFIKKYMNNGKKFTLVSSEELSVGDDAPKENNKKLEELFGNFEKSIVFTKSAIETLKRNISSATAKTLQTDPSLVPWDPNSKFDWLPEDERYERYRYVADLNFDSIMDLALSEPLYLSGTGGSGYTLYLGNADGGFIELEGWIFGGGMSLKKRKAGEGILCIYGHGGGGCGSLTQYSITSAGIKKISSKMLCPDEDDESREEDCNEFGRIFNDKDTLIPQISKTSNGNVFWLTPFHAIKSIDKLVTEIVVRAKADDKETFGKYLVAHRDGDLPGDYEKRAEKQSQKLIEMVLRSDMENNYKQRLEHISSSNARLNYHYLEKGCHFQIELEKIEEYGTWHIKNIWFCR